MTLPGIFIDPRGPLARLVARDYVLGKIKELFDKMPPDVLKALLATAGQWPSAKMDEIKTKFLPKEPKDGMGCMGACYDMISILYSPKVKQELLDEVLKRAMEKAKADAKRDPAKLTAIMDRLKAEATAKGKPITDDQAKFKALWEMTSPHNSADHLFNLMHEKGLASEPVALAYQGKTGTWSPTAEKTISDMTGDRPGTYFFGLSVSDYHTVTLAVDRKADGSEKIYWFDQHQKGLGGEIPAGKLGETLKGVRDNESRTTRIWAFQPPAPTP